MSDDEKSITNTIGNVNTTIGGAVKEGLKNIDIPNVGKSVLGVPGKVVDGVVLIDKVAKASTEKEKFTEVYQWGAGTAGAGAGAIIGGAIAGSLGGGPIGAVIGAGAGAYLGNQGGEAFAKSNADKLYSLYQSSTNIFNDKGQTMNPNFLTLLIGDLAFNTPNTTKQHSFILSKALINESLEFPFSIECEGYIETIKDNLLDKSQDLNPKNLINQPATFSIKNPSKLLNNRPNKVYSGILSNVKYLGFETLENSLNHRHFFSFKVESVLIKMSLNKANRIYIDLNVPEVIKETLNFYNDTLNKEIDFSNLLLDYEKQELISQYQESDLEFLTRIAHNCGIFFYETSDKIYFCDHYKKGTSHLIPYNSNPNNNLKQECINAILQENQISANSFTHSSTHFSQPANISTSTANPNPNDALSNKHFYENAPISKVYENRFKMLDEILNVKSNIYELQLCDFLEIKNFREKESFVLVANTQILSNDINFQGCENVLTLLPNHLIFTPSPKVKPKAPNCTQGIVIGKGLEIEQERNTIYTDDYGRVKVRINLYAAQESIDEKQGIYHHTPFLRVASPIASHHSGFYHTPRVGDEVIISFLDEDIDKPYVSSSLYNGTTTMPQYNYPRYKREIASDTLSSLSTVPTMINKGLEELQLQEDTDYSLSPTNNHYLTLANSTIGTDNVEARARNEITLKNDKDKEEIYILAQKDYKEEIGNNYEQTIKSNKTSEVGALYTEFITLGHMQNIVGFKNVNVGAEYLENTLLSKDTNVGLNNTLNVGVNNEVNITQNYEEKIGNDKKVIVDNNLEQVIGNDSIQRVGHNKNETIQGSYVIQSNDSIKMFSKKDTSIETNEYFKAEADDSISFKAKNDCSFTADFVNTLANKENIVVAQKKIVSQVGDATIEQTKDKVIIQVGKVQVIIDSKGLRVKGGDLRAD